MACDAQTFTSISAADLESFIQKGASAGVAITRDGVDPSSGIAIHGGVSLTWKHDPAAQTLTIQCVKKPFIDPCHEVNKRIAELVESARSPQA